MPMSDDEFLKRVYGPTGKPPEPGKERPGAPPGRIDQFITGLEQGAMNPPEAIAKWTGHGDVIPDWAKDIEQQNKQSGFWGKAGEMAGTTASTALAGVGLAAMAPEWLSAEVASLPWIARAALGGLGGAGAGLLSRYPETDEEMKAQALFGGLAGGAGGLAGGATAGGGLAAQAAARIAARRAVDPALVATARQAAGVAARAEADANFAMAAAAQNPALQQRAAALAQRAAEAKHDAEAAANAASPRPWGFYENIHEHFPALASLLHPIATLKHLAGQAALHTPPGAVGGAAGVIRKDDQ